MSFINIYLILSSQRPFDPFYALIYLYIPPKVLLIPTKLQERAEQHPPPFT